MALSSKASVIPTTNEFLSHWTSVDSSLTSGGPFILPEEKGVIPPGFNRSGLVVFRDLLQDRLDAVQDKLNGAEIARGGIASQKAIAYKRLTLFLEMFDGFYKNTDFYVARPTATGIGAGEENFMAALRDVKSLWPKLNAAVAPSGLTLPIELNEGTNDLPVLVPVALFTSQLTTLRSKYEQEKDALQELALARGRRDKTIENIRTVLVSYREAVRYRIAGDQALIDTIPRLTPEPGHTPDAVNASAALEGTNQARISHTQSDDADFARYELRGAVGDNADAEDAVVLDTHSARVPADFVTAFGLGSPGAAATFWVYVVTADGNERGSVKMVVERP